MSAIVIRRQGLVRWTSLAVAGLMLAASTAVYAQTNDEKEKERAQKAPPAAAHKNEGAPTAPAAIHKNENAPSAPPARQKYDAPPAEHKSIQPANQAPVQQQTPVQHAPAAVNNTQATPATTNQQNQQRPSRTFNGDPNARNQNNGTQNGSTQNNTTPATPPNNTQNQGRPNFQNRGTQPTTQNQTQPPPANQNPNFQNRGGQVNTQNQNQTPQNQMRIQDNGNRVPNGRIQNGTPPGVLTNENRNRNNRPADFHGANNTQVHYGSTGQPQVVRTRDMTIEHTPVGTRRVVVERPDRTVIVTNGAGHGYVQRPYVVNNVTYVQRNYYVGGVAYTRVYRPYRWGGISLNVYVPGRYYSPVFYSWAYSPWDRPVSYRWGWAGNPWYSYYGGWFTPYPTYVNATFWLTDYMIAATLQQAYLDRQYANSQVYDSAYTTPLTSDVKQAIADEVRLQLNEERAAGQQGMQQNSGAPDFLTDNQPHVFVVSNSLFVESSSGECPVTEGDVLQMTSQPRPGSPDANLIVMASKGRDCRKGTMVTVGISELADMESQMRATIDQGLGELQRGQGGIPAPPPAAQAQPVQAAYAAAAPPPDPNVATELTQQAQQANQAETEALNQAQQADGTVNIGLGMSFDEVVAIMGRPAQIADLGSKKTYFYPNANMKVIFVDGKVSDVQ